MEYYNILFYLPPRKPLLNPIVDLLVGFVSLVVCYLLFIKPLRQKPEFSPYIQKIAFYGWIARIGGAFFVYYLYFFYYGYGDIINYMIDAQSLVKSFFYRPLQTIHYMLYSMASRSYTEYFDRFPDFYWFWVNNNIFLSLLHDNISQTVPLVIFPLNLLAAGSINATIILFSTLSYLSYFYFFMGIKKIYPHSWEYTMFPILFMPSVLSWTSLPFKEGISLSLSIYAINSIFLYKKRLHSMILSIPALYFAYAVKPYIVISLIPVLGLIIVTNFNLKATTHALNYLIYPFFATAVLFGSWYLLQVAAESTGKYSFQNVATQAYLSYVDLTRHESYYHITMGGSVYDIGEFEPTIPGMLSKFPIAFYTGLFRPFLWEARKPIILLTSLEITAFSLFLLYGLLKYGVWRVLRGILENPWSIVFMIFSVFFIYMMGLTSGNFGNLVRYRVPGLFFFYTVIFATYGKLAREVDYRRQRK